MISNDQLTELSALTERQRGLEIAIENAEKTLKELQEEHRVLTELTIPEVMMASGVDRIRLTDGSEVSISKFYAANIPKPVYFRALDWLEQNGFGGIIKNEVVVPMGKDSSEAHKSLTSALRSLGYDYEEKRGVHHQTLGAFVRERMEAADPKFSEVATELFGVHVGNKTKLKTKKA